VPNLRSSPTLVPEALMARFSLDQIEQLEKELDSPSPPTSQVCAELKQGSISRKIVDVWIESHKGKVNPWIGLLPTPHRSPVRTLREFLVKAKVVERPKELKHGGDRGI
jgi:hypothetical protein